MEQTVLHVTAAAVWCDIMTLARIKAWKRGSRNRRVLTLPGTEAVADDASESVPQFSVDAL